VLTQRPQELAVLPAGYGPLFDRAASVWLPGSRPAELVAAMRRRTNSRRLTGEATDRPVARICAEIPCLAEEKARLAPKSPLSTILSKIFWCEGLRSLLKPDET
jgi:hypothetical protein